MKLFGQPESVVSEVTASMESNLVKNAKVTSHTKATYESAIELLTKASAGLDGEKSLAINKLARQLATNYNNYSKSVNKKLSYLDKCVDKLQNNYINDSDVLSKHYHKEAASKIALTLSNLTKVAGSSSVEEQYYAIKNSIYNIKKECDLSPSIFNTISNASEIAEGFLKALAEDESNVFNLVQMKNDEEYWEDS